MGEFGPDAQAKLETFFGVAPRVVLDDVYRLGEDYLADTIDSLESEVMRVCEENERKRKLGRSARTGSIDVTALQAEVAAGIDKVWELLVSAYAMAGDMFEAYALRNCFTWPTGLDLVSLSWLPPGCWRRTRNPWPRSQPPPPPLQTADGRHERQSIHCCLRGINYCTNFHVGGGSDCRAAKEAHAAPHSRLAQ